jgi:hypothetical protein
MTTTGDELSEAERLAAEAATVLAKAEGLVDEAVYALNTAAETLAKPGAGTTDEQIRQAARYRLALADALEVLRVAGLGGG